MSNASFFVVFYHSTRYIPLWSFSHLQVKRLELLKIAWKAMMIPFHQTCFFYFFYFFSFFTFFLLLLTSFFSFFSPLSPLPLLFSSLLLHCHYTTTSLPSHCHITTSFPGLLPYYRSLPATPSLPPSLRHYLIPRASSFSPLPPFLSSLPHPNGFFLITASLPPFLPSLLLSKALPPFFRRRLLFFSSLSSFFFSHTLPSTHSFSVLSHYSTALSS